MTPPTLAWSDGTLVDGRGRRFDPAARRWHAPTTATDRPAAGPARLPHPAPSSHRAATAGADPMLASAVRWLQTGSGHPLRVPVGVIGPRDASDAQLAAARAIGIGLGEMRLAVVCGGRHGVMQAVAEGVHHVGGVSIGLLPDPSPELGNPFLTHVIATGLGEARNAVVARSAFCLVAIGDSYGTLSEVALGRQFGKAVFGLCGAARVDGVVHLDDPGSALDAVARRVLALDPDQADPPDVQPGPG